MLLSVTILLSFSLLLGYLFFTDASIYNKYREIFSYRRGDVLVRDSSGDSKKMMAFLDKLDTMDGTNYYVYYHSLGGALETTYTVENSNFPQGNELTLGNWQLYYLPDYAWLDGTLNFLNAEIVWAGEPRSEFFLASDEALLCEGVYHALGFEHMEDPVYTFRFHGGMTLTLRIAGYMVDQYPMELKTVSEGGNIQVKEED